MLVKSLQLIYNLHAERSIQAELQLILFGLSYLKWYCVVWEERKNACFAHSMVPCSLALNEL